MGGLRGFVSKAIRLDPITRYANRVDPALNVLRRYDPVMRRFGQYDPVTAAILWGDEKQGAGGKMVSTSATADPEKLRRAQEREGAVKDLRFQARSADLAPFVYPQGAQTAAAREAIIRQYERQVEAAPRPAAPTSAPTEPAPAPAPVPTLLRTGQMVNQPVPTPTPAATTGAGTSTAARWENRARSTSYLSPAAARMSVQTTAATPEGVEPGTVTTQTTVGASSTLGALFQGLF